MESIIIIPVLHVFICHFDFSLCVSIPCGLDVLRSRCAHNFPRDTRMLLTCTCALSDLMDVWHVKANNLSTWPSLPVCFRSNYFYPSHPTRLVWYPLVQFLPKRECYYIWCPIATRCSSCLSMISILYWWKRVYECCVCKIRLLIV